MGPTNESGTFDLDGELTVNRLNWRLRQIDPVRHPDELAGWQETADVSDTLQD